jgi:type IV secretion system protein VirB1
MFDFAQLAQACAPQIHANTLAHVVQVESHFNPWAIGVVGGHLVRQPRTEAEAIATAKSLEREGRNYSAGLAQLNRTHFAANGLTPETAFEPCHNLQAAAKVLTDCYVRAYRRHPEEQRALRDAFSCYYAGNFKTGYESGYVFQVVTGSTRQSHAAGDRQAEAAGASSALLF